MQTLGGLSRRRGLPAHLNSNSLETWAVWAAVKKYTQNSFSEAASAALGINEEKEPHCSSCHRDDAEDMENTDDEDEEEDDEEEDEEDEELINDFNKGEAVKQGHHLLTVKLAQVGHP